eukprot:TRINITY_DN18130_c0_g1_i2.p1 TRINITY_DN18130_c0_g1~~TRINITY_DN18130_c0_g1_i2.p1  ORF type:complete len:446 (+),score=63.18 TRINITY_DN18130_c0_g1_i2:80-1339(+)
MSWAHPAEAAAPGARPPTRPEDGVYAENGTWYPPGVPLPRGHRPACLSGVCRYWQAGRCLRGAGCPNRHPPPSLLAGQWPARWPHSGTLLTTAMPPSDTEIVPEDVSASEDTLLTGEELDALRDEEGKLPGEYPPQHVPDPAYTAAPFRCTFSRATSQSLPSSAADSGSEFWRGYGPPSQRAKARHGPPGVRPPHADGGAPMHGGTSSEPSPQGSPLKGIPPPRPPQQRGAACGGVRRKPPSLDSPQRGALCGGARRQPTQLDSPLPCSPRSQCSPRLLGISSRQGSPTLTQIVTDSSSVSPRPGGHAACGHAPRQEQLATPGQGPCVASAAAAEPDFLSQVRQLQGQFAQMQEQLSAIPRLEQRVAMLETENTALRQTVEALRQQSYAVPGAAGAAAGPPLQPDDDSMGAARRPRRGH